MIKGLAPRLLKKIRALVLEANSLRVSRITWEYFEMKNPIPKPGPYEDTMQQIQAARSYAERVVMEAFWRDIILVFSAVTIAILIFIFK